MRVPYGEGVASHTGPESCGHAREGMVEALTGVRAGWVIEPRNPYCPGRRRADVTRKAKLAGPPGEGRPGPAGSKTPGTHASISLGRRSLPREGSILRDGSREIPRPARMDFDELSRVVIRARAVNPKGERRR